MTVRWTEAALADLGGVEAYIARHSPRYARGLVERIIAQSELLVLQPRLGPVVPEYEKDLIRELFVDPYRVVYRVLDDQVDILAVVHAARRMPRGL